MSIVTEWESVEQRAILITFTDWTVEDHYSAIDELMVLLNSSEQSVTIIYDLRRMQTPPAGMIFHLKTGEVMSHPNFKQFVVIGNEELSRSFVAAQTVVLDQNIDMSRLIYVHSIEEARRLI